MMEELANKEPMFRTKADGAVVKDVMIEIPVTKEALEMEIQMHDEEMARAMDDYNRAADKKAKLQEELVGLLNFLKIKK